MDCWNSLSISWETDLQLLDMVLQARMDFGDSIFREIFITACWTIWTTRNSVIFDSKQPNLMVWKRNFKEEIGLVCTKAKQSLGDDRLSLWKERVNVFSPFIFLLALGAL